MHASSQQTVEKQLKASLDEVEISRGEALAAVAFLFFVGTVALLLLV